MGGSSSKQILQQLNDVLQSVFSQVLIGKSTSIANYVSSVNSIKLNVKGNIECSDLEFYQMNKVNLQYKNELNSQDITDLKSVLNSQIDNKTSQTMKIVREFLGSFGSFNSDDNITMIQTRLKQIINNQVNIQHENKILNQTVSLNNIELNVDGSILVKNKCIWNQTTLIDIVSSALVNDLVQTCVNDEIINRIVNDSKQKFDLEEKGPASFLMALALVIFALAMFAKEGLKAAADYRLWLLAALAILIAYIFKFFPFKKVQKKFYGCQKQNKLNTGQCVEFDNPVDGPFFTKELCEKSKDKACPVFYGCEKQNDYNTGKCVQYSIPLLGPYSSQNTCEESARLGKDCKRLFSCGTDTKGYNIDPPICVEYRENDPYKPDITYPTMELCEQGKNRTCAKHFACDNARRECVEVFNSPYITKNECQNKCG